MAKQAATMPIDGRHSYHIFTVLFTKIHNKSFQGQQTPAKNIKQNTTVCVKFEIYRNFRSRINTQTQTNTWTKACTVMPGFQRSAAVLAVAVTQIP